MNKILRLILILTFASLACNLGAPSSSMPGMATSTFMPEPIFTQTATLTPPPDAGQQAKVEMLEGAHINYRGISFTLDASLGSKVYVFEEEIESSNGQKARYTRFAMTPEEFCETWCIEVYPVQEFVQVFGHFTFPPGGYGGGAVITFSVNAMLLGFQNGEGSRALEMHGQMTGYVTNGALKYVYRGYTENQKYAVFVQIPVSASILPDSVLFEENINPNAIPIPTLLPDRSDYVESVDSFNEQASLRLASLPPDGFSPGLDMLDAMAASIKVESQ